MLSQVKTAENTARLTRRV